MNSNELQSLDEALDYLNESSVSFKYVISSNGDHKRKGNKYKPNISISKLSSSPKKALLLDLDISGKEPIKISKHLTEGEDNVLDMKISILKLDPKALDEYGYRKIVSEEKGTLGELIKKYGIKIEIQ